MSDNIFKLVENNSDFKMDNPYIEKILDYAIPHVISELDYYWRRNDLAESIVSDDSFHFIWEKYPKHRESLLKLTITSYNHAEDSRHSYGVTPEFSKDFLTNLYSLVEINAEIEDNRLRARLIPYCEKDYDYLGQICEYSLDPTHGQLYDLWKLAGMRHSKDCKFYDYLFSKVKREPGSTDEKVRIVQAASENNALSDLIVSRVAKSSPKSLKRATVSLLCENLTSLRRIMERSEGPIKEIYEEKVEKEEGRVMLFVGCDDNEVVSNLIDCLSKDNLPWLMPSVSKHPWLARRLQQKIDYLSN